MKKTGFILFLFLLISFYGKGQLPYVIKLTDTTYTKKLDSLYLPLLGSKGVLNSEEDLLKVSSLWSEFLDDLNTFLDEGDYRWLEKTQLCSQLYCAKDGTIDYYYYRLTANGLTDLNELNFRNLLAEFLKTRKFPLTVPRSFSISGNTYFERN